jgi:hypothetical protein
MIDILLVDIFNPLNQLLEVHAGHFFRKSSYIYEIKEFSAKSYFQYAIRMRIYFHRFSNYVPFSFERNHLNDVWMIKIELVLRLSFKAIQLFENFDGKEFLCLALDQVTCTLRAWLSKPFDDRVVVDH